MRKAVIWMQMSRNCAVGALLLSPMLASKLAFADSAFGTKPGVWEITTVTKMAGMPIPADAMANMPEAARARIEAAMGSHMAAPRSTTVKSCVTQKDLDEDRVLKSDGDSKCTRKLISKSATSVVMEQTCPAPQAHTSHMNFQASSPTAMVGTIDVTRPDGFKMHIDMKGRWLGASCAGIGD